MVAKDSSFLPACMYAINQPCQTSNHSFRPKQASPLLLNTKAHGAWRLPFSYPLWRCFGNSNIPSTPFFCWRRERICRARAHGAWVPGRTRARAPQPLPTPAFALHHRFDAGSQRIAGRRISRGWCPLGRRTPTQQPAGHAMKQTAALCVHSLLLFFISNVKRRSFTCNTKVKRHLQK